MKKFLRVDLIGQLACLLGPGLLDVLIFRDATLVFYSTIILNGWQLLSVLFWGTRKTREEKSYGRRVYEKIIFLVLALVMAGLILLLLDHPFLIWTLYFLFYGFAIMGFWYLGITIMELVLASRRERR